MAAGMNWGIMSLLVIIVSVLAGVAAFFVFLAKRSATASRTAAVDDLLQPVSRNNYG
jgi:flagellar basal body-associated protein FliL